MIASLIGLGVSAASSIFGGIKASREAKKQKRAIEAKRAQNEAWYNRRYNEDGTQRADAVRLLTMTQDNIRQRNRAAAGRAAVTGGTEESIAADKEAGNEALANATSTIAAQADARKDTIEQQYQQNDEAYVDKLNNISTQKANNIANAVQGVASTAGQIGETLDAYYDKSKSATPKTTV
jgi:hypothetical protein